jgi:hypothetical protein
MTKQSRRQRGSAALTELVDRAADSATNLGNRAADALLTTISIASEAITPVTGAGTEPARAVRRRNPTVGGAARGAVEAAAKTNRKLARTELKATKKTAKATVAVVRRASGHPKRKGGKKR